MVTSLAAAIAGRGYDPYEEFFLGVASENRPAGSLVSRVNGQFRKPQPGDDIYGALVDAMAVGSDVKVRRYGLLDVSGQALTTDSLYYYDDVADNLTITDTGIFAGVAATPTQIALNIADIDFLTGDIRSIQTGMIYISGLVSQTATISKVSDKAVVHHNGQRSNQSTAGLFDQVDTGIELTDNTTLTAYKLSTTGTAYVYYTVIDYK